MKFTITAVLALATGAFAGYSNPSNATVITVTTDVYTTYCPAPTHITHGSQVWTVTEATTLTMTGTFTVTKPVYATSTVICHTSCSPATTAVATTAVATTAVVTTAAATTVPVVIPTYSAPSNGTVPTVTYVAPTATAITAGAGKAAALSGAGLAGLLGLAALAL